MMSEKWTVNSDHTRDVFLEHVAKLYDEHKHVTFTYSTGKQRTSAQNAALHKYLEAVSQRLNDAGLDQRKVIKPGIEIPWGVQAAKEYLWRPIQKAMTGKDSTTKPHRDEYVKIYEVLNRHLAHKFGISEPWPCKDDK